MKTLQLISATAAVMLLGAGVGLAQDIKTNQTPDNKQQTTDKGTRAGTPARVSSQSQGRADMTSKRTARHVASYADRHHGPLYDSYQGDLGHSAAAWGCAHGSSNGNFGVGYAHRTLAEARSVAMDICGRAGGAGCYVISCSAKAETETQAQALWPQASFSLGSFHCGSPGEQSC